MDSLTLNTTAILISILSLVVAAFSLGWNVYRDVVFKARLIVNIAIVDIMNVGVGRQGPYINITGTNFGPDDLIVNVIVGQNASFFRHITGRTSNLIIMYDHTNPISNKLPKRIAKGEQVELFFPYNRDCFLKEQVTYIGLRDSFRRSHWATSRELKAVKKRYARDFPDKS